MFTSNLPDFVKVLARVRDDQVDELVEGVFAPAAAFDVELAGVRDVFDDIQDVLVESAEEGDGGGGGPIAVFGLRSDVFVADRDVHPHSCAGGGERDLHMLAKENVGIGKVVDHTDS